MKLLIFASYALSLVNVVVVSVANSAATNQSISEALSNWVSTFQTCSDLTLAITNNTADTTTTTTTTTTTNNYGDFDQVIQRRIAAVLAAPRVPPSFPDPPINLFIVEAWPIGTGFQNPERDYKLLRISFGWGYNTIMSTSIPNRWDEWSDTRVEYQEQPKKLGDFDWADVRMSAVQAIDLLFRGGYQFRLMQIAKPKPGVVPGAVQIYHIFVLTTEDPYAVAIGEDGISYPLNKRRGEEGVEDGGCAENQMD